MTSLLFTPLQLGPLAAPNRIAVAPMCQYSAIDGVPQPWHRQHLGALSVSGAGVVVAEATGVVPEARITHGCTGLWNDGQERAWADIVRDMKAVGPGLVGILLFAKPKNFLELIDKNQEVYIIGHPWIVGL